MCDSSVSTGIFPLTDCLKAVAVRGGAEQTAVHHSYIPTVTTSRATSRAQLQPASHSIPIRPGLISISVVTAARGLSGCVGPHSPSVRAQPHLPPSSHRSRPKLFSYFSCDSLPYSQPCSVQTLAVHTGCTLHHYLPITLPILTTWPHLTPLSSLFLIFLPPSSKTSDLLIISLTVYLIQVNMNYKSN